MPTPAEIIQTVASLMNDTAQQEYTSAACLPYLNMALRRLQEKFELNDVPVTKVVSAVINISAGSPGITEIGFNTAPPLPSNLIEINQIWESPENTNQWTPLTKRDFIPHYLENDVQISQFLIWAWNEQKIQLITADADNDIKLDYIKYLFAKLTIIDINTNIDILNVESYLQFKTAAYCAMFIGEDSVRAGALDKEAEDAINDSLGISTKGAQSIMSRRRPFRAAFKARTIS